MRKNTFILGSIIVLLVVLLTGTVAQAQTATPPPAPPDYVVILVVDDFSGRDLDQVNKEIKEAHPSPNDLCYLNPSKVEGQAMADGMGGGEDASGKPIPHGNLVLAQVLDMINQHGPTPTGSTAHISAVPVQVKGYTVPSIANEINRAIADVTAAVEQDIPNPTINFVVNMSFALVPCGNYDSLIKLINDLSQYENPTDPDNLDAWNEFHNQLYFIMQEAWLLFNQDCPVNNQSPNSQSSSNLSVLGVGAETILSSLRQPSTPANCSLIQVLQASNVVSVASAGNFGLDFPTLPAAWDNVVSVSAGQECDINTGGSGFDYNFDSAGGHTNRLVFQKPTFGASILARNGNPCASASTIASEAQRMGRQVVYFSSSGEIMMPGLWNYVGAFTRVNNLTSNDLINLLGNGIYDQFYDIPNHYPNFGYSLPTNGGVNDFTMGTSFAAPKLSFAIALYLANVGSSYCLNPSRAVIGFKYASFPTGPWNDYDLGYKSAITTCNDFYDNTNIPSLLNLTVH